MSYRSLLVLLDQDPLCTLRMRFALRLAQQLECSLVGVAPTGLVDLPAAPAPAATLANHANAAWDQLHERAERAVRAFGDECRAARFTPFDTVVDIAARPESLVRHGRCNDLTVLTQADPSAPDYRAMRELVEQVVLRSARPTLLLPYAGRAATFATHPLVAWDDSREAARALSDALPLLQRAHKVQVVCWDESHSDTEALRVRLEGLRTWLTRHRVSSDVRIEPAFGVDIADALLSHAADMGADLIVMGAYGHARWAERMLGGATRGVLASMTVPVLMSH